MWVQSMRTMMAIVSHAPLSYFVAYLCTSSHTAPLELIIITEFQFLFSLPYYLCAK